jgi:uncharacterized membrane protein
MTKEQDGNMVDISTIKTISNEEYSFLIKQSLELDKLKSEKSVSYKRHIFKAISYRALGSFQTCLISYFFTGNFLVAGSIGLTEICIKPIIYFFHERMWYTFSDYGVKNKEIKKD